MVGKSNSFMSLIRHKLFPGLLAGLIPAIAVILSYHQLDSEGPLLLAVSLGLASGISIFLSRTSRKVLPYFILPLIHIAVIFFLFLIIPFSVWIMWLDLAAEGKIGGSVSFVFAVCIGLVTAFPASVITKRPLSSLCALAAAASGTILLLIAPKEAQSFTAAAGVAALATLLCVIAAAVSRFMAVSGQNDPGDYSESTRSRKHWKTRMFHVLQSAKKILKPQLRNIAIAILILGSAALPALFSTNFQQAQGSRSIDRWISPALRNISARWIPGLPLLLHIPTYGYNFNHQQISERPQLSDILVFSIDSDSFSRSASLYLRTDIYQEYTGAGWQRRIEPGEAITDNGWILLLDQNDSGEQDEAQLQQTRIQVHSDYLPSVPHRLQTRKIRLPADRDFPVLSASLEHGLQLRSPLMRGDSIVLAGLPASAGLQSDGLSDTERNRFTQVPSRTTEAIQEIAAEIKRDSNQETLDAILGYLGSEDFRYSLEPPRVPADKDILSYFLNESQSGFCVHFAGSLVLLARLSGIPARYVSGFYLPPADFSYSGSAPVISQGGSRNITGYSAHVWAEIYLEDYGWVTVEATPPMRAENPDQLQELMLGSDRQTSSQLSSLFDYQVEDDDPSDQPDAGPFLLYTAALIVLIAVLLPLFLMTGTLFLNDHDRFRRELRRLLRSGLGKGLPDPRSSGWQLWCVQAHQQNYIDDADMIFLFISSRLYGRSNPDRSDIQQLKSIRRSLKSEKTFQQSGQQNA
ncbi:transglutaminase-like domain-containing protein [Spirochaeta dissipatitropha]